ncbi:hypothetical protein D9757_013670 [Collybiopsis confluens]|uniref:RBR-type E3 ubiquitin transferase n=1 Tax=Collybiopsis confluens TaxID=2823264 RepID=A0A8H5GD85_9AGAR|nr:hypothetical protein D9757_013670 [Collybiopsis confluens]
MSNLPTTSPRHRVQHGHRRSPPFNAGVADATAAGTRADLGLSTGAPKPCAFFARGHCRFGDRCHFHHGPVARPSFGGILDVIDTHGQPVVSSAIVLGPEQKTTDPGESSSQTSATPPVLARPKPQFRASPRPKPCFSWTRKGSCAKGNQCPYAHEEIGINTVPSPSSPATSSRMISPSGTPLSASMPPSDLSTQHQAQMVGKRRANKERNEEKRKHLAEREKERVQIIERQRVAAVLAAANLAQERKEKEEAEVNARRLADLECQRKAEIEAKRKAEWEANRKALELESEAKRKAELAEKRRSDALVTIQRIQLGSTLVTFSAGLNIGASSDANGDENPGMGVIPGFETCRVMIRNIPLGVRMEALAEFLDRNMEDAVGLGKGKAKESSDSAAKPALLLVSLKRSYQSQQEGVVVTHAETGRELVRRLDGIVFRNDNRLKIELNETGGTTPGMTARRNGTSLKISWRLPSARYTVTYGSEVEVDEKIRRFNSRVAFGRTVKVERDTGRGRAAAGFPRIFQALVIGLPPHLADDQVQSFFEARSARKISNIDYNESLASTNLKNFCTTSEFMASPQFDEPHDSTVDHTLYARFENWNDAKRVYDALQGQRFSWIGNASFNLWLPDPVQYEISIPYHQYRVQLTRWKTFLADTREKRDVNMRIIEKPEKNRVFVRVGGTDVKAVGTLKVRVESLAAGQKLLGLWHRSFFSDHGRAFLRSLDSSDALIVPDWRHKVLKAFGEVVAIGRLQEAIEREIERLAGMEYTVSLKRDSVKFFTSRGVAYLKERFGEENVLLNISSSPCRITIRGGDDARHALHGLIDQSLQGNWLLSNDKEDLRSGTTCPICLDEVSVPVQLGCGHEYCSTCLHHFFTAEVKNFPIVCLGNDTRCMKPIALPIIQEFLTENQFNTLLETAFAQYIEKNPNLFRYCPTPDCERLYRCAASDSLDSQTQAIDLCCPSCFCEICSRCNEEVHEGMTCRERQQAGQEELNSDWAVKMGAKKCTKCGVWIEKTDGCNHIACRCGAHICWYCMDSSFDAQSIYMHMREAHGGIGIEDVVILNEDVDAQRRALDNWNNIHVAGRMWGLENRYFVRDNEDERRRNDAVRMQQEQMEIHAARVEEQRMRDLETTRRTARQEEGGNWCTIM